MSAVSRADGGGVVVERGAVGGADLAQPRAAGFEDFGDAETAADLDQFAARDDDFLFRAPREMPQHQDERRGAVVDDRRRFRADRAGRGCVPGKRRGVPRSPAARSYSRVL